MCCQKDGLEFLWRSLQIPQEENLMRFAMKEREVGSSFTGSMESE